MPVPSRLPQLLQLQLVGFLSAPGFSLLASLGGPVPCRHLPPSAETLPKAGPAEASWVDGSRALDQNM